MLQRDKDGSIIQIKDGQIISKETTTFNEVGKHLEWIRFNNSNEINEIRTWQFDKNNRIVEWNYLNPDRSLKYQESCKYDDYGNRTEFIGKDGNEYFTFNSNNQELTWHFYEKDSTLRFERIRIYDKIGNMVSETFKSNGKEVLTHYKYDQENRLIEESGGPMNFKTIFHYGSNIRTIQEIVYNNLGELISNCINEYDEEGNLIKESYI